jgi:Protein of unknown function (DUF3592)
VSDEPAGYVRGAAGIDVGSRSVGRLVVRFIVVLLAVLTVVLVVQGVHQNSLNHRLQSRGVPVDVVITHCVGRATGTGITTEGYDCTGRYVVNGRSYSHVVGGTSDLFQPGQKVAAIADPRDPTLLATVRSVATTPAKWKGFISAAITFAVLLVFMAFASWWSRRKGRTRPRHAAN